MAQQAIPSQGFLRVVGGAQLTAALDQQAKEAAEAAVGAKLDDQTITSLAAHIRSEWTTMKNHRQTNAGWNERLLAALRAFNGQYSAEQLQAIRQFGGSDVYARLVAMKCRGASSLLRDIYLGPERAWGIAPPADPDVPPEIMAKIHALVQTEVMMMMQQGAQPDMDMVRDRVLGLTEAAREAAKRQAEHRAKIAEDRLEELLNDGDFYKAFAEFLVDVPLFPYAVMKGPVVRMVQTVKYVNGTPVIAQKPKLFWERISPFDLYWTPGVSDLADAAYIEKLRLTRARINDLLDLPGYNTDAVRAVLDEYGRGGLSEDWDSTDSERAVNERRENPTLNQSGMISCLEYHGNVQGRMLIEYGMDEKVISDPMRDYMVQAWLIGRHIIKAQLSPNPRRRAPYYVTSFEKVPGTPVGNALPDVLADIQDVCNASLRALVNNLSISSGPQVMIDVTRLSDGEDAENLYPWKRWFYKADPMGSSAQVPISFFQPNSNAQELMAVYQAFSGLADELSGIPKYLQGSGPGGGAGRTASGLAMLMGNANKILQTVAANIDRDVVSPLLTALYDMVMLTDTTGMLQGDEEIEVKGVNVAVQKETQRARQLEFLQITANPIDLQIMGPKGRAIVLGAVSSNIGLEGEKIIPSPQEIEQMQTLNMQAQAAQAQGMQQSPGGDGDTGPRTNITGGQGVV